MGVGTLLRRRLLTHPVALVAVATSAPMSMVVVATLQLLSSVSPTPAKAPPLMSRLSGVRWPSPRACDREPADVDRRVRAALAGGGPDAVVTRTSTMTSRGIEGRDETDRAVVADLADLPGRARLTAGAWPSAAGDDVGPGGSPLKVALPVTAAEQLDVAVGSRLFLPDLVNADAKPLPRRTGTYEPTGVDEGLWVDDPLGLAGVSGSDFTTYGPFVAAEGSFDRPFAGSSTVTWRGCRAGPRSPPATSRGACRRRAGHRRAAAHGRHPA